MEFLKGRYKVSDVLDYYTPERSEKDYDGHLVKMNSDRYLTFKTKGCVCVSCGREGTHFKLQKHFSTHRYHFGLWSEDNVEMTKDHIVPVSKGGKDSITNYQPMCELCNTEKGSDLIFLPKSKPSTQRKPLPVNDQINRHKKTIQVFMTETHINPYLTKVDNVDVQYAVEQCIGYFTQIIRHHEGNISPHHIKLRTFPKRMAKQVIKQEGKKFGNCCTV